MPVAETGSRRGVAGLETLPGHQQAAVQAEIEHIRSKIARMARLAERALTDGMQALRERNRQVAYAVIIRDRAIDELEQETDRLCLEFLVRQQPVAKPLRFAYTALKINAELERVGDYAQTIAQQIIKLIGLDAPLPVARFQEIADRSVPMLRDAVRAFLTADGGLARRTLPTEDAVDVLKSQLRKDLVRMYKENQLAFEALDPSLLITRRLERVSDQARNICAETLYLCTGEFAKHRDADLFRVLFLDRHNNGVSLMAEALGEALHPNRFAFSSAGFEPRPVPSEVLGFMQERGLDLSRKGPKSITAVPDLDRYHIVVTFSPETKQLFPGQPRKVVFLEWPLPDPALVQGSPAEVRQACENACQIVSGHLKDLIEAVDIEDGA